MLNRTKVSLLILACIIAASIASASERSQSVIKVTKPSDTEVTISCRNGGDPAGTKIGNTLIISCGK